MVKALNFTLRTWVRSRWHPCESVGDVRRGLPDSFWTVSSWTATLTLTLTLALTLTLIIGQNCFRAPERPTWAGTSEPSYWGSTRRWKSAVCMYYVIHYVSRLTCIMAVDLLCRNFKGYSVIFSADEIWKITCKIAKNDYIETTIINQLHSDFLCYNSNADCAVYFIVRLYIMQWDGFLALECKRCILLSVDSLWISLPENKCIFKNQNVTQ